jgi:hypothetical protein
MLESSRTSRAIPPEERATATADGIRLYVLDGGWIRATCDAAAAMSGVGSYWDRMLEMPIPRHLIRHPDDDMM